MHHQPDACVPLPTSSLSCLLLTTRLHHLLYIPSSYCLFSPSITQWGDPKEQPGVQPSTRNMGYFFGPDRTRVCHHISFISPSASHFSSVFPFLGVSFPQFSLSPRSFTRGSFRWSECRSGLSHSLLGAFNSTISLSLSLSTVLFPPVAHSLVSPLFRLRYSQHLITAT